jgi:hypothetical protein
LGVKSKRFLSTESNSKSCFTIDKGQKRTKKTNMKRQSTDTFANVATMPFPNESYSLTLTGICQIWKIFSGLCKFRKWFSAFANLEKYFQPFRKYF